MKRKFFIITFLLIILIANVAYADFNTVTMKIVEEPVCTISLTDKAIVEKKIISKDLDKKEITIQLKATTEEQILQPSGEIVLLLDNSYSMTDEISTGVTRKDLIFSSAKTFVTNALKDNNSLKISIVSFSTNSDYTKEGTLEDAKVETALTNNLETLISSINGISADGARTDLDAGLQVALTQFSNEDNNKYLIVLTDGVPNVAVGYDGMPFSDDAIEKTQAQLQNFKTNGINLITMLTGVSDENATPYEGRPTYKEIITSIFGTSSEPTVGTFYYVTDSEAENTILNTIYNSLLPINQSLTNIKITDYIPKEIVDNFEFSYVLDPNVGEISKTIDKTTNSLTWDIPELTSPTVAIVQYKLKLKENFDSSIVDKLLNTTTKVDVTYNDLNNKAKTATSNVTPVIKLTEPLPTVLPKAGIGTLVTLLVIATLGAIYSYIKIKNYNKILK